MAVTSARSDRAAELRLVSYDHPDVQTLVAAVQQEYVLRYGGPDETPIDVADFAAPRGRFYVAYVNEQPVAMGGWRPLDAPTPAGLAAPVMEIKRMYVPDEYRHQGHARAMLHTLETSATSAGAAWIVLETGEPQPEAIGLYEAAGYRRVPAFGHYAAAPLSRHLGKRLSFDGRS